MSPWLWEKDAGRETTQRRRFRVFQLEPQHFLNEAILQLFAYIQLSETAETKPRK